MIGDWLPTSLRRTHHFFNRGTTDLHILCNWNIWTLLMAWRWRFITSPNPDQYHSPLPYGMSSLPSRPGARAGRNGAEQEDPGFKNGEGLVRTGLLLCPARNCWPGPSQMGWGEIWPEEGGDQSAAFKRTTGHSMDQTLEGVVVILWQLQSFYKFI